MRVTIRRDLGLQLLALYLLFVGPIVLASLAFDRYASQRLEADVKTSDLGLAQAIAQETNTTLSQALQAVSHLAEYDAVIEADHRSMEALFTTLMSARPDINLVYRLDETGEMLFHVPTGPGSTVGVDFSFRDYYQQALESKDPLVSLGRISPTTEQPVTTAVMPIWDEDGQFLGLVATNIKLQSLSTTLESIAAEQNLGESFSITIVDAEGRVIAHPNPDLLLSDLRESLPEITKSVLSGESGNLISDGSTGQQTLYTYVPIPSSHWGVIVSRPTAAAFATLRNIHRGVLLVIAVFLVVGLFFWLALSRQVLRPLEQLAVFSRTIGLEEESTQDQRRALQPLSRRPDQIGHLIRSLSRMEHAIDARLNELSTLLETSAAVVSTLDSQTVLNRILEQVEKLMDIRMCAIVALDERHGIFKAQASRGLSKRYSEQLAISPSEPQSVTLRAIRNQQPIQVSDTETDPTFVAMRPRSRSEGYRAVLAVPLNTQHAPPSALLVYKPEPHVFTKREINLLTNFANHAAMAIENASLYTRSDMRLNEQTRRLEALIQSLQEGLVLEDLNDRVLYANRRISQLVNLPLDEIVGSSIERLIERILTLTVEESPEQKESIQNSVTNALSGQGPRRVEIAIKMSGRVRYLQLFVFDVTDADRTPIGRGQILRDITHYREIDRMKSSLISTVSHELRTPLAAIKGYTTTLLADDVEWDMITQREFLQIISEETDHLNELVSDLLDMSRIEAGNLYVSRVECSLQDIVDTAAQRAHPSPDGRLKVNLPDDLPIFYADPKRIEAVLRNLIENAAKYAGNDTPIEVSAAVISGRLIIRVADHGPGIPPEHSKQIFDSFYRLENGLTRQAPGAGLGLAICKGFIQAHGGEIWLEPQQNGTCVAFSLPLTGKVEDIDQ